MADMISRAAAIEHMKEMAGCATCDNYNYVRCRACNWDDAMNIVEELPAVDAVPVEWLKQKTKHPDSYTRGSAKWILGCWKREQEAR